MDRSPTRYARNGDCHLAYQVFGDGPVNIVWVPTWLSHVEVIWEDPAIARFFERLGSFGRVAIFDRRGTGLSDPLVEDPTLEAQMDDIQVVMDAAGMERAAVFAILEAAPMSAMFAATKPDRVDALVMYAAMASVVAVDDVPWTTPREERLGWWEEMMARWGTGQRAAEIAPSRASDRAFIQWFGKLERYCAAPATVRRHLEISAMIDIRGMLDAIRVPTLVLHRKGDRQIDVRHAHYLAERIPSAKLVLLEGSDTLAMSGDAASVLDEIEEFLTGERPTREADRVLATVLFTDIVDSTTRAAELGDARWRDVLEAHETIVRRGVERHRGRLVKTLGDGALATFDGPARGIRCAREIEEGVRTLGVALRAGLHTGEVEIIGNDVGGLAVHIGARVADHAGAGEVLVSSTVKELVAGSGIEFSDRGSTELRGVPGEWRLFAVAGRP